MKKTVCILAFLAIAITGHAQTKKKMKNFDPTFVHTVFFWMKDPGNAENNKKFEVSLRKFLDSSKYAKTHFIGTPPKATREVVDDSFTYSLVLSFDSAEAQEKYQTEEAHLLFIEESQDFWEKVIVYDSQGIAN